MTLQDSHHHPIQRMAWWILASLMLHLFLLSLWSLIPHHFETHLSPQPRATSSAPVLKFVMIPDTAPPIPQDLPPQHLVIPTIPSQAVPDENPNAILESDQNTHLKSREQGSESPLPIPQQKGDPRSAFSYVQSPALKPSPQKTQPQQESKPSPPTPEQPPSPAAMAAEAQKNLPLESTDGVPLFPQNTPQKTAQKPAEEIKKQAENKPNTPSTPMSFARDKSQMTGGKSPNGDNSPEAKATDLGRYKSKIYRSIGSRWYIMVDQQMSLLAIGAIKIKFFVQANGVIRDIQVAEGSGRVEILEKICIRSVRDSGPFEPFSDHLKQQLGEGYWEDITFTIY